MKIALRLIGILLTICVIAVGFRLPDTILSIIDGGSAKVHTEELPPVNLDMKRELSLYEKLSLANTALPSVEVTRDQTSSIIKDVTDAVQAFMNSLVRTIWMTGDVELSFFYAKPYIYYDYAASGSAVFWHISASIEEECYLAFVVDDRSLEVLAFTLKIMENHNDTAGMNPEMAMLFDATAISFEERFGGELVDRKSNEDYMQSGETIVYEIFDELLINTEDNKYSYSIYGDPWMISFGSPYDPFVNYDGYPKTIEGGY